MLKAFVPWSDVSTQCKFWDSNFATGALAAINSLLRRGCEVVRISFNYPLGGRLFDDISRLPDLEDLVLSHTKVTGELSTLARNTNLTWLDLHETRFSGNLNGLKIFEKIQHLDVSGTSVSGGLSAVANAILLQHLDVSGTSVSGDLVAVANATLLQHLDVSRTSLSGDLVAVANASKLQHLDVSGTSVSGDLMAAANAKLLDHLDVSGTSVSGDLKAVAKAVFLEHLDVSGTSVSGDLVAVADAFELKHLDVSGTSVSGDLTAVANAKYLQHLDVSGTSLSGDLVAVANASKLQHLDVSGTSLSGDLVAVANASKLQHLDLSKTLVSGDVGDLKNAVELKHLRLSGSNISGVLLHWKEVQELHLSGTKVQIFGASFLEDFWPMDAQGKWICPFPSLKYFDVSGTPLSTTVEKLLRPFLGCRALEAFKAAECNLTGAIPSRLQVDSQGSFRDHIEWPVSNVLKVLDLASNNVARVEALPPKCQAVMLAGNPSIDFKTGVLKKAISNKVALDLRNVKFLNKRDTNLNALVSSCLKSRFRDRHMTYLCGNQVFNPAEYLALPFCPEPSCPRSKEASDVLDTGVVKPNDAARTVVNQQYGFACCSADDSLNMPSFQKLVVS